ncbi:MAG TPA: DUF1501 domain-containing protein [Nocardioides sp.]|jgi:uncharacterized protein (DUF1501 family)|nr:DUF1501 domain-containing protein [Nocardioides sp.]
MTDANQNLDGACCAEYAAMSRRSLLRGALALGGATTMVGSAMVSASASSVVPATSVLVVLSLRGAADGLSLVVPFQEKAYYDARPNIAIPPDKVLLPDERFGLHPSLEPLTTLWQAGRVAAVHATGLPVPNRSHFSAMEELEDADPGSSKRVGWLNRLVGTRNHHSPLQAVGIVSGPPPTELVGPVPLMTVGSVADMEIAGDDQWDTDPRGKRRRSLETLWGTDRSPLGKAMRSSLQATTDFAPVKATADHKAAYGNSDLGRALSEVARVIRGNVGVEVLTVDQGDWDMHSGLGTLAWGQMITNAGNLATAIAAFFGDLGDQAGKVTLVALSEFGRRVAENDNYGLDHGYGNVMFVAGAGVVGGYHCPSWPELGTGLDADLTVTTDYRSVLAEIVSARFGSSASTVFPGFTPETVGVMQGD